MKNFPKSFTLNIFGRKTSVKVTKNLALNHGALGFYSKSSNQIQIADDQTKDEAIQTLIHEAGHALFQRCGVSQAITPEMEEVIVEQFSIMIFENFTIALKNRK